MFRIRMEGRSDRGRRFTVAGNERAGAHTRWFDLVNLKVTADGINTVDEACPLRPAQVPAVNTEQSAPSPIVALTPSNAGVSSPRELRPLIARRLDNAIYEGLSARVKSATLSLGYVIAGAAAESAKRTRRTRAGPRS